MVTVTLGHPGLTTFLISDIRALWRSKTIPSSSHIFFHSTLSVAVEQSGSEPRRLRGVGDPAKAWVQAPPDHGRGRAAPACRGGMGPSGPGSD